MDVYETLFKLVDFLNKNSNRFCLFSLNQVEGYDYKVLFEYSYYNMQEQETEEVTVSEIYRYDNETKQILINYDSLEKAKFLKTEIGYNTLFKSEHILENFNKQESKTTNLYILKANYSDSILVETEVEQTKYYTLKNILQVLPDEKYIYNLEEVRVLEENSNIIFDYYMVNLLEVLVEHPKKLDKRRYIVFDKTNVIDKNLFDKEDSVDYYNTVLAIKQIIKQDIDHYKQKVYWEDNRLTINGEFCLEVNESYISYDLEQLPLNTAKELLVHIKNYNECKNKITNKYVVIDKTNNYFLQSEKTPSGEFNIYPLKSEQIHEFDENCIFYLEELNEKFPDDVLLNLYSDNKKYEIIAWKDIEEYKEQLFYSLTDKQFLSIITQLNAISKRVV